MKRLLLLSYVFPPQPSPGALRPSYLTRYLPQFGWDVTVLTNSSDPPPFDANVLHVAGAGGALISRLPFRLRDSLLMPDVTVPWIGPALRAGLKALRGRKYDAILSTALPASVHLAASRLARASSLPWIADYRDPWSGNAYVHRGALRTALEHHQERSALRAAQCLTTISVAIAEQLRTFHNRGDVYVIPNAYDPAEWEGIEQQHPARFDLCYTGSMYDGKRSPDLLFEAVARLRAERDPVGKAARIHFYGPNSSNVAISAERMGVTLSVSEHGVVPRREAMLAQRGSAALLIFLNMDSATATEMGSKFLEYIGARRPILAFGPQHSVMRDFIRRHRLGWFASDVDQAKQALRAAYAHFTGGSRDLQIDTQAFPTAPDLARRFAERLDAAVAHSAQQRSEIRAMEAS
jgi:glycosyltransferase involved in cell wall biosynthesis